MNYANRIRPNRTSENVLNANKYLKNLNIDSASNHSSYNRRQKVKIAKSHHFAIRDIFNHAEHQRDASSLVNAAVTMAPNDETLDRRCTVSPTNITVNTTPDEDAVDRVANEFRFLDERPLGSSSAGTSAGTDPSTHHSSRDLLSARVYSKKNSKYKLLFIFLACFLQICFAVALLVFAGIRFNRITSNERSNRFVDFNNPHRLGISNESVAASSIQSASSWLTPSCLHLLAALTASWSFLPVFSPTLQVLYMIFSSCSIISWFNGVFATAFELNVYYLQANQFHNAFAYIILIFVILLMSINAVLIPTFGIIFTSFKYATSAHHNRSRFHIIVSSSSILLSAIIVLLSIPCVFFTAKNIQQWSSIKHATFFHLIGLRELVVSVYSLVVSIIGFIITFTSSRRLRFSANILYCISLVVILIYVLNGEHIFAVAENFHALRATQLDSTLLPVNPALLLSIYIFFSLLAISLLVNITVAVHMISVTKGTRRCTAVTKLPPYLEFNHRSHY